MKLSLANRTHALLVLSGALATLVIGIGMFSSRQITQSSVEQPPTMTLADVANTYIQKYGITFSKDAPLLTTFTCAENVLTPFEATTTIGFLCRTTDVSSFRDKTRLTLAWKKETVSTHTFTQLISKNIVASQEKKGNKVGGMYKCDADVTVSSPLRGIRRDCTLTLKDSTQRFFSIFFFKTEYSSTTTFALYTYNALIQDKTFYSRTVGNAFQNILAGLTGAQTNLSWLKHFAEIAYAQSAGAGGDGPGGDGGGVGGAGVGAGPGSGGDGPGGEGGGVGSDGDTGDVGSTIGGPNDVSYVVTPFCSAGKTLVTTYDCNAIAQGMLGGGAEGGDWGTIYHFIARFPGTKEVQATALCDSAYATSMYATSPNNPYNIISHGVTVEPYQPYTCVASCNLPWGGTLADGSSVTRYEVSSVVSPATCSSEVRTCSDGILSGVYGYTQPSCTVVVPEDKIVGACNNMGGYTCIAGTLGTHSGNATDGWTWYCDGTPNDAAHRSVSCFYKPTATPITPITPITPVTPVTPTDTPSVTWTNYCTGLDLVQPPLVSHPWQIWAYSNETPAGWKYIEPGTVANGCVAPTATVYGCMDSKATNYNSSATSQTGVTCTYATSVTWTNYCTGLDLVQPPLVSHPWQIWAYSNETPAGWKYIEPGTVANGCVASAPSSNGSCSVPATHYSCSSIPVSTNNVSGTSAWTWTCPGTGTGTSAPCSEDKFVVTSGVCTNLPSGATAWNNTTPSLDTVYKYSASNPGSTVPCKYYNGTPPPGSVTANINASPVSVSYGDRSTLSWSSSNATSCSASGGPWSNLTPPTGNSKNGSGLTDPLTGNTTFSFTCNGTGGPVTDSVTVTVGKVPSAPVAPTGGSGSGIGSSLSASPETIHEGSSSVLTWGSSFATSCTSPGGFSTGDATSGHATVSPANTSTYQVTCSGVGGSSSSFVTVIVLHPNIDTFSSTPSRVRTIPPTNVTNVSWSTTDVTSCSVTRNGVPKWSGTSSSGKSDTITGQTLYTITCDALPPQSVTVNVVPEFKEF